MSPINLHTLGALVLATAFGPIVGAVLGMLAFGIVAAFAEGQGGFLSVLSIALFGGFYVGVLLGIPATIVAGLPIHAALLRFAMRRAWQYAIVGAPLGMAFTSLVVFLFSDEPPPFTSWAPMLPLGALIGAGTAWAFWVIRRPDHDPPNPTTPAP